MCVINVQMVSKWFVYDLKLIEMNDNELHHHVVLCYCYARECGAVLLLCTGMSCCATVMHRNVVLCYCYAQSTRDDSSFLMPTFTLLDYLKVKDADDVAKKNRSR